MSPSRKVWVTAVSGGNFPTISTSVPRPCRGHDIAGVRRGGHFAVHAATDPGAQRQRLAFNMLVLALSINVMVSAMQ